MNLRAIFISLLLAAGLASEARAQSASSVLAQGVQAYQQLELSSAARLIRHALGIDGADSLTSADRANALMYLFATEHLAGRRDSAAAVSLRLLSMQPQYLADALVFPPEIVAALERRRREVKVLVAVPGYASSIRPREETRITLVTSSSQPISAAVLRDGVPLVSLYEGNIDDTLEIVWNGLDAQGSEVPGGSYAVSVSWRDARGRTRSIRLPVEVASTAVAVADVPPAEAAAPRGGGPGLSLGAGIAVHSVSSQLPGVERRYGGVGLAGDGAVTVGRLSLRVAYGEATLANREDDGSGDRKLVEGSAMLGIQTLPFLTFWIGPHARAWQSDLGNQRWLLWEIRADLRHEFIPQVLGLSLEGWSVASASVDAPTPFERGVGAQGAVDLRLARSALVASLSYRLERARVEQDAQYEANNVLSLMLRYQPRR